jgi:hypothetical protein
MEDAAFRTSEGLVPDEVVEAPSKPCCDYLQRAKGGTHEARLDLTDETFGQLIARQLCLAHTELSTSGADPLAQRYGLLNYFGQTRHRRSPA